MPRPEVSSGRCKNNNRPWKKFRWTIIHRFDYSQFTSKNKGFSWEILVPKIRAVHRLLSWKSCSSGAQHTEECIRQWHCQTGDCLTFNFIFHMMGWSTYYKSLSNAHCSEIIELDLQTNVGVGVGTHYGFTMWGYRRSVDTLVAGPVPIVMITLSV